MSNKTYDILKLIAQIALPAVATFVVAICKIWELPYGEAIAATLMAIDTMMGSILHSESLKYHNGGEIDE